MVERKIVRTLLIGGVAYAAISASPSAMAQESAAVADEAAASSREIVVTAAKREERLIDVGGAISAISESDLAYRDLQSIEDFASQVPGFNLQTAGNRSVRLILRGLNTGGSGATTAVIVDETPLSYQSGLANGSFDTANIDTFDMARIEVLKGPQGTLYGATAQGGLLKYVTNAPRFDKVEAGFQLGTEVIKKGGIGYVGRGLVNIPLIDDKLAFRASGFYEKVAGYIDNPLAGITDANEGKRWGGRVSLLFKPVETLSIRATALRQDQEFDDNGGLDVVGSNFDQFNPPANEFDLVSGGRFVQNSYLGNPSKNRYEYANITADLDLGFASLVSSTSWGGLSTEFVADISFANAAPGLTFSDLLGAAVYGQPVFVTQLQTNAVDRFNQELRLTSSPDTQIGSMALDWQLGGFYAKETIEFLQGFDVISRQTGAVLTVPIKGGSLSAPASFEEYSGYANATLHFTDTIDLALGGRYSDTSQRSQIFFSNGFATGPVDATTPVVTSSENKFTYSAALRWKFNEDSLLYGRVATGYRAGGPNFQTPGLLPADVPTTYGADTTTNYEVGLRTAFFDKALSIDIAAFYIDWKDIQISTTFRSAVTGQNVTVVGNAGTATSKGVEWNIAWEILPGLTAGAVGSYTRAKLTDDAPLLGGESGDQLPFVPKWSNTLNLDYETELGNGVTGFIGGSWNYVGNRTTGFSGSPTVAGKIPLGDYSSFNLQAGFDYENYNFSLFARNLTDKRALTGYGRGGGAFFTGNAQIIQPQTFGARLTVRY